MRDVVAVVVTYNRKDMLTECIAHLQDLVNAECDILIIDNASTDGTYEQIKEIIDDEQVKYYNTGENLGGAGGFNYGMNIAYKLGYKYIWLMDDDTNVEKDALYELLEADNRLKGNYGFLSSVAYWRDGSLCNMNTQRTALRRVVNDYNSSETPIIMATFVSFFLKREVIKEYGLPIRDFFIWSDDMEYSRRISLEKPCYVIPRSKVLHNMSSNSKGGIETEKGERINRYQYLYRNEVYVYRREGIKGWIYVFLRVFLHTIRVLFKNGKNKGIKMKIICSSFIKGLSFHPVIEYVTSDNEME